LSSFVSWVSVAFHSLAKLTTEVTISVGVLHQEDHDFGISSASVKKGDNRRAEVKSKNKILFVFIIF
jgi:hypothetical protein